MADIGTKALVAASAIKPRSSLPGLARQSITLKRRLTFFTVMIFAAVTFAAAIAMPPAFAGAPALNVQKICKTRDADAKTVKSTTGQSVEECVHDEEVARQQLDGLWDKTSARSRNQCTSEARSLGTTSYLDLLTCIQMVEEMKADAQKKVDKK